MARTQVRLGLVFQGGVSLAVWMGGVAQEIDLLRRAGAPDRAGDAEAGGPALRRWRKLCDDLDIDVVVDVVSGTSAGGVNGALLASAIATGNTLPPLGELWAEVAQLQRGKLLREAGNGPLPSLLDGRYFSDSLRRVLDRTLARGGRPAPHPVTLLTTATALGDQQTAWTDSSGDQFGVADHRRVYRFRHDPHAMRFQPPVSAPPDDPFTLFAPADPEQLTDRQAAALTRAARATAGFPAAFEPVDEHDGNADLRPYRICGGAEDAVLVDGGLLDNTPFEPLLAEIAARPVHGNWRRVIGYVTADDGLAEANAGPEVARGWLPVLAGTLGLGSETSFRLGVEALAQRSLDAQRHVVGPEQLFSQALAEPEPMAAAAATMYEQYRQHRVDSGVLDACLIRMGHGNIRPMCIPALDPALPDHAPQWVPPASYAEATTDAANRRWRWGTAAADRTVRLLIRHLRAEANRRQTTVEPALGELSRTLTAVSAIRDYLSGRIAGGPDLGTKDLVDAVNEATRQAHGPEVLGALMDHAVGAYAGALPDPARGRHEVMNAALAVEVITRGVAGRQPFRSEARFDVARIGPDVDAALPVQSPRPPGGWKLFGTRLARFGAFGTPEWRQHDYLWGRLDGAAHLVRLLTNEADPERVQLAQRAVLEEHKVSLADLAAGLRTVASLDTAASLDAIRDTPAGRQALEDTVTDLLRMLRDDSKGTLNALLQAGGWLSTVLAKTWPSGPPPALLWKIPLRTLTILWPRARFWRWVRGGR